MAKAPNNLGAQLFRSTLKTHAVRALTPRSLARQTQTPENRTPADKLLIGRTVRETLRDHAAVVTQAVRRQLRRIETHQIVAKALDRRPLTLEQIATPVDTVGLNR